MLLYLLIDNIFGYIIKGCFISKDFSCYLNKFFNIKVLFDIKFKIIRKKENNEL